jgi:hypothetical protein
VKRRKRRKLSPKAKAGPKSLLAVRRLATRAKRKATPEEQAELAETQAKLAETWRRITPGPAWEGDPEWEQDSAGVWVRAPRRVPSPVPFWERNALLAPANPLSASDWLCAKVAQWKEAGDIPTSMTVIAKRLAPQMDAAVQAGKCLEAVAWPDIRRRLYGKKLRSLLALR